MTSRDSRSSADSIKDHVLLDPKIRKVHDYWLAKHHDAQLPSRSDIDPVDLSDCLSHIMIFDVMPEGRDFTIRLAGLEVERAFGRTLKDQSLSELFRGVASEEWHQRCRMAVLTGDPDFRSGDLADLGRPFVRFDCAMLPLSGKDGAVTQLLCCYKFSRSELPPATGA